MLSDAKGLLESMFSFDKDNIPEKVIQKIQPYIENPDFEPKKIESVSKASAQPHLHHAALLLSEHAGTLTHNRACQQGGRERGRRGEESERWGRQGSWEEGREGAERRRRRLGPACRLARPCASGYVPCTSTTG
eukprot:1046893-Pleurochrysis_carterae.AAC.1